MTQRMSGHPDDDEQRKYKLVVAALKKLCGGANTPIPEGMQVAVWVVRTPAASNQKGCVARVCGGPSPDPPPPPLARARRIIAASTRTARPPQSSTTSAT